MEDADKLRFLGKLRELIGQADQWADEKISSGAPASQTEAESIEQMLAMLARIKHTLAEWKAELRERKPPDA
jgi:hypothetical protein